MKLRILLALLTLSLSARAAAPDTNVDVHEHVGDTLPLDATFVDETGRAERLGERLRGDLPVVLVPAWYECPMLCGLVLKGVVEAVKHAGLQPGKDFRILSFSFDPHDTPVRADRKRMSVVEEIPDLPKDAWHFLVAQPDDVGRLTRALGYDVRWDEPSRQFMHPAAIAMVTSDGRISRYLYGVEFPVRDFRLALQEARAGRGGPAFDRVLLTCFHYDPATRRYGFAINVFLKTGASLVALALFVGIAWLRRRETRGAAP